MADVLAVGGRRWVRGNRWDLVRDAVASAPQVAAAIVVPYFEQPASLRRMYAALTVADLPADLTELVVVDDGSSHPPPPPPTDFPLPWQIRRQPDLGCRPGAARNTGVDATAAEVLIFLDSDTVPAPSTVRRIAAWPSVLPDALVVGRRHHAELATWSPAQTTAWLTGAGPAPVLGPDPVWLDTGYGESANLLHVDRRSYRFVISAVMACHRTLFDDIGGFDPTRSEYGGEDWELAHRAFANGAVLVHDPDAVAWHDELDWADRNGQTTASNRQTLWLAATVPDPLGRSRSIRQSTPEVHIDLRVGPQTTPGQFVATVDSLLTAVPDSRIVVSTDLVPDALSAVAADPRLSSVAPPDRERRRQLADVVINRPLLWEPASLIDCLSRAEAVEGCGTDVVDASGCVVARVVSTRNAGRARRARRLGAPTPVTAALAPVERLDVSVAGVEVLHDEVDLAAHHSTRRGGSCGGAEP